MREKKRDQGETEIFSMHKWKNGVPFIESQTTMEGVDLGVEG